MSLPLNEASFNLFSKPVSETPRNAWVMTNANNNDKHKRILQAAIRVFAENGFFNSKVAEIAKAANVADGTIYLYFKNKDDILISLFEDRMKVIIDRLSGQLKGVEDPLDRIRVFIRCHFQMVAEEPELAQVITVELRQSTKFMKEYDNKQFVHYLKILSDIIRDGKDRGLIRKDITPGIIGRALFGMLDELSLFHVLSARKRKYDLEKTSKEISEFFIRGLCSGD